MRHMTGGKDARESPRVPGRRRVVERCAADQVYACRRGGGLRLADPDADGVERRVHALPADRQAEAGGGADQGARRLRFEEARNQPTEVSGRNGGNGRRPPGHERGVRPVLRREADRHVRVRGLRGERAAAEPVRSRRSDPYGAVHSDPGTIPARHRPGAGAGLDGRRFLVNPNNPTGLLDELGNAWTPWNPLLGQTPNPGSEFHLAKYIQRFFLESQVTVSILSNANLGSIPVAGESNPPPKNIAESLGAENLTGHMTAGVRDFVNQIAGSTRMLAHGQLYPGVGNLHDPVYGDYT